MFVQSRGCCALLHSFSRSFRHNGLLDVRKVKYKVSIVLLVVIYFHWQKLVLPYHNLVIFVIGKIHNNKATSNISLSLYISLSKMPKTYYAIY